MRHAYSIILLALGVMVTLSGHLISDLFAANAATGDTSHLVLGFLISLFGAFMMVASLIIWEKYPRK